MGQDGYLDVIVLSFNTFGADSFMMRLLRIRICEFEKPVPMQSIRGWAI